MAIKDSAFALRKRLKLDSHHTTERFGIVFAAFGVSVIVLTAAMATSSVANTKADASQIALYTPEFTTSKTGLSGDVAGVYVSEDSTRSLVLMEFSGASADGISVNSDNYQSFLTGSTMTMGNQELASSITGEFIVFGTTGYVGVVMDSDVPFEEQILNLTVRANSQLVYAQQDDGSTSEDFAGEKSFAEFDQWRVYVNPGAQDAIETAAVTSAAEEFSPADAYYELVVKPQEDEARLALDSSLAQMQVDLAKIDEYTLQMATTELGGQKIVPPMVPMQISGDTVTGTEGDEDDPLTLRSRWTSPEGYSFDWRNGSVADSYLDDLVAPGQSYVQYLTAKSSATDDEEDFSASSLEWLLTDGSSLMSAYSTSAEVMSPLFDVMNNLTQAYQTYYNDKVEYQTDLYDALISLEVSLKNVDNSASVNDSEEALITY